MRKKIEAIMAGGKAIKNLFTGGKQKTTGTEVVNPFKANPQTRESKHKIEMATIPGQVQRKFMPVMRDLQKASVASKQAVQKLKGEKITDSGVSKGKDMKAKGGRVGYKKGTPNPFLRKSNKKKIEEAFKTTTPFMVKKDKPKKRLMAKKGSPDPKKKKKFPDLTGDGKVTFADILKGRGVINGKKNKTKKKII